MKRTLVFLLVLTLSVALFAEDGKIEQGYSYLATALDNYSASLESMDSFDSAERTLSYDIEQNKEYLLSLDPFSVTMSGAALSMSFAEGKGDEYSMDIALSGLFDISEKSEGDGALVSYSPVEIRMMRPYIRPIASWERPWMRDWILIERVPEDESSSGDSYAPDESAVPEGTDSRSLFALDGGIALSFRQNASQSESRLSLNLNRPSFRTEYSFVDSDLYSREKLLGEGGYFGSQIEGFLPEIRQEYAYFDTLERLDSELSLNGVTEEIDVSLSTESESGVSTLTLSLYVTDGNDTLLHVVASTSDESVTGGVRLIDVPKVDFIRDNLDAFVLDKLVVDDERLELDEAVGEIRSLLS